MTKKRLKEPLKGTKDEGQQKEAMDEQEELKGNQKERRKGERRSHRRQEQEQERQEERKGIGEGVAGRPKEPKDPQERYGIFILKIISKYKPVYSQ